MTVPFIEENDQTLARREHLDALRALVGNVYPNKFVRSNVTGAASGEDTITSIVAAFKHFEPEIVDRKKPSADDLETVNTELNKVHVSLAGPIAAPPRVMGKAAFLHLSDGVARLQIYIRRQDGSGVRNDAEGGEVNGWDLFALLDHGDFVGVDGYLFVTKTGELSVHAEKLQFLAKALLPMPDKMHGINDPEIRQRQRYADLIAGSLKLEREENDLTPREVFELRSKVLREIRRFLDEQGYVEVETPMLTAKATGALAKPFKTHHNALDIDLYARIAPELYLKRLVVGGFEKVYELNRNFRNEGIDRVHNPEFTMLEFYWAYADVNQMMDCCEELLRSVVKVATGGLTLRYNEHEIDFSQPFARISMKDAIAKQWGANEETMRIGGDVETPRLDDFKYVQELIQATKIYDSARVQCDLQQNYFAVHGGTMSPEIEASYFSGIRPEAAKLVNDPHFTAQAHQPELSTIDLGIEYLFEYVAEASLIQPTFITDFPKAISPLSKASPSNASIAERFEFFVGALETANGFSELNDPEEQYQRFKDQAQQRERGDEEAMVMDEDYIRALSYGMPPAAGIGVGIDRLTMLLTNKQSIRDVILFPHMRPEKTGGSKPEAEGQTD